MKKKIVIFLIFMLLILSQFLPVTGKNNDETYQMLNLSYEDRNGLVIEAQRYEEKCVTESGAAGGRWVYKYTVRNTGNIEVTIWGVSVVFPTQWDWLDLDLAGAPAGWIGMPDLDNPDENIIIWVPKFQEGEPITLGPGGSVNNFVIKTKCWPQDQGGASAIPTEGRQHWEIWNVSVVISEGDILAEQVDPDVHKHGVGYTSDHPAEYSFDKDHTTYAKTTGSAEVNWIIYDFKVIRQTHIFRLFSRYDSDECMSPAEIQIAVGENDDGTIDQLVGNFLLPQAESGEIVSIDLDEIIEKRFVQLSILSRYNDQGDIVDPTDAEFAEIEFCTYVKPANHCPSKPQKPSGPTSGKPGTSYPYTSYSTDEDEDDLSYLFSWGDGTDSGWVGPYSSGQIAEASHAWANQGNYQVKVKAKDVYDVESDWSDLLSVTMPRSKTAINTSLLRFLQQYPNLFSILRIFLQRVVI